MSTGVGIVGSGLMAGKIGIVFARDGHEVVFSYARSGPKLRPVARDGPGSQARAATPREAAQDATTACWPYAGLGSRTCWARRATCRAMWS